MNVKVGPFLLPLKQSPGRVLWENVNFKSLLYDTRQKLDPKAIFGSKFQNKKISLFVRVSQIIFFPNNAIKLLLLFQGKKKFQMLQLTGKFMDTVFLIFRDHPTRDSAWTIQINSFLQLFFWDFFFQFRNENIHRN